MTLMFRIRRVVAAVPLGLIGIAPVSVAQTPPTNLQVSNFHYSATAKEHRFTFTWDAAKTAAKAPYPSYQLSLGKSCWYEKLNAGDRIEKQAATAVLYPSGPLLGVTVVCGCPRRVWGYSVHVTALGPPALAATIDPKDVPADRRHPTNPSTVLLVCT